MIAELAVVVPARDEEQRIGRCLAAIEVARAALAVRMPAVTSRVVVVLDGCTDGTAAVLQRFPGVQAVECSAGRVGVARGLGAQVALAGATDPDGMWLACTDADSRVPADWLITHASAAACGVDLLLGTVRPTLPAQHLQDWLRVHELGDGHPHVHGANLGVRGGTYCAAGGFPSVARNEDVLLAERIRALGACVRATGDSPVLTSARTTGRAPDGFAGWIADFLGPDRTPVPG
jgi:glycosyltransferase involved in cell wall biosynthesis